MAIKAPNYLDLVGRPWVERAIAGAAATVFVTGVTAVSTFGSVEITPMLAAPTYSAPTASVLHKAGGTTFTPASFLGGAPARRSTAAARGGSTKAAGSRSTVRSTATGQPTVPAIEAPRATGGGVSTPSPTPPAVDDPQASNTGDPGVSVAGVLGDALDAIEAGANGVGTPAAEPTADGVVVTAAPEGLPPIVIAIP